MKNSKNIQSILRFWTSPIKPINDFNEIIAKDTEVTLEAQANPTQGTGILYANVFYRVLSVGSTF